MEFKCSVCKYTSNEKDHVIRHINKKNKCGINPAVVEIEGNISCVHCGQTYKTYMSLNKHHKQCKRFIEHTKTSIINNTNSNNNNNNNNKSTVTINVSVPPLPPVPSSFSVPIPPIPPIPQQIPPIPTALIPLRPYLDPKLPADMNDLFEECWIKMCCVLTFVERIYCDITLPENHSICITNLQSIFSARVFNGVNWETLSQHVFVEELVATSIMKMKRWVEAKPIRKKYLRDYEEFMADKNELKMKEDSKNEVRLLLYNYSKTKEINIKTTMAIPYVEPPYTEY